MRHPLWILNSFLLVFILFALLFVSVSRQRLPLREEIALPEEIEPMQASDLEINIRKIYEDDLFNTYTKEQPEKESDEVTPLPQPPRPRRAVMPEEPKAQFFDPLNITLKGITVFGTNTTKNRAIIADNKTDAERIYKEGDTLEDAQLVRILRDKVVFLRSNGQQEVLYLREKDAQNDISYRAAQGWDDCIKKVDANNYLINPVTFIERIKNLANFIDIFDITTVYKKGSSIGCRIGTIEIPDLAKNLGLQTGDIIQEVAGVATTTPAQRVELYKKVKTLHEGDNISISGMRQGEAFIQNYTLKNFSPIITVSKKETVTQQHSSKKLRDEQKKILQKKHTFAPTVQELRARERDAIRRINKQKTLTPITE